MSTATKRGWRCRPRGRRRSVLIAVMATTAAFGGCGGDSSDEDEGRARTGGSAASADSRARESGTRSDRPRAERRDPRRSPCALVTRADAETALRSRVTRVRGRTKYTLTCLYRARPQQLAVAVLRAPASPSEFRTAVVALPGDELEVGGVGQLAYWLPQLGCLRALDRSLDVAVCPVLRDPDSQPRVARELVLKALARAAGR